MEAPVNKPKTVKFTVECEMRERWVPHFLAMLKYMQKLGAQGSSRKVTFYSDGDGDFNPKFKWDASLPSDAKPRRSDDGDNFYDAG